MSAQPSTSAAQPTRRFWLRAIAPVAACLAHAGALGCGFVWLDHSHIVEGLAIAPPDRWAQLFTQGFAGTGYFRPLTALSLSIDALAGHPWVFHATTLVWHALAALGVVIAGEALGLSLGAAALAGVLFAVHPISSIVADAIAFRSEAMIAVALLALVVAHVRRRPALAAAAVLFGALVKETALALAPLFIVALELGSRHSRARSSALPVVRRRALLVAEVVAFAAALGWRWAFAPDWRATHPELGVSAAIGTRLAAVTKSALALVAPVRCSVCDAFPMTPAWAPMALLGLVVLTTVGWLGWQRRGAAALLALATLPILQIVPVQRWWSPHYVYLPAAFAAMLAGASAARFGRRGLLVASVIAIVLAAVSFRNVRRFTNDTALWTPEVTANDACREGHFYLAEVDRKARRWDDAARRFEAALRPRPGILAFVDRAATLQNLGTVRLEQGRFDAARAAFELALAGTSNEVARRRLVHNIANAVLRQGDAAEAARLLAPEVARPDAFPESMLLCARALHDLGRDDEARALLNRLRDAGARVPPERR